MRGLLSVCVFRGTPNIPLFSLNGKPFEPQIEKVYARFELEDAAEILMELNIGPRWIAANDEVRANTGKTALMLGPFVYRLEETDNGGNLASISVLPETKVQLRGTLGELPGGMPKLEFQGYRISGGVENLYGKPVYTQQPVHLTGRPYCLWCNREPGEMLVWQKVMFVRD